MVIKGVCDEGCGVSSKYGWVFAFLNLTREPSLFVVMVAESGLPLHLDISYFALVMIVV